MNKKRLASFWKVYGSILRAFAPSLTRRIELLINELSESEVSFREKIDEAYAALQSTAHLLAKLESELTEKIHSVEHLQKEHERYVNLVDIEKEKATTLLRQIEKSLTTNQRRERAVAFGLNLFAGLVIFLIGVILGPILIRLLGFGT